MSIRKALIIAIQDYPNAEDLGSTLPDTITAAENFYKWLTRPKGLQPEDVIVCCDTGDFGGHPRIGTIRSAIIGNALTPLIDTWRDKDPSGFELYFFFSGHGLGFQESLGKRAVDALICSDYINRKKSGGACLRVDELQEELYWSLAGAHHYFFIDACRTIMGADEIKISNLGVTYDQARLGSPTRYTIYSTAYGEAANVNSGFSPALLDGLRGVGHAKGWLDNNKMYVTFELLQQYISSRVKQPIDPKREGPGEGRIVQILPVPKYPCRVEVRNAQPLDEFKLIASWQTLEKEYEFMGPSAEISLPPNYYDLRLLRNNAEIARVEPAPGQPVDLFSECRAVYDRNEPAAADFGFEALVEPAARLSIKAPPHVGIVARNLMTGLEVKSVGMTDLPGPGVWQVEAVEAGETIASASISAGAGERLIFDPLAANENPIRRRVIEALGAAAFDLLGPIADPDPALWLSLLAGARVAMPQANESPLASFESIPPHAAMLYVLAAVEGANSPLEPVAGMPGLYQYKALVGPGSLEVAVGAAGFPDTTYAVFAAPDFVSILIVVDDKQSGRSERQYLLPISKLRSFVGLAGIAPLLRFMRFASNLQRRYHRNQQLPPPSPYPDMDFWTPITKGEWLDPLPSLIAAYSVARQPGSTINPGQLIRKLRERFPALPDLEALAKMFGFPYQPPQSPPLLLEGQRLFREFPDEVAENRHFDRMWSSWRSGRGRPAAALIIAIENYPDAEDMPKTVPGSVSAAESFYRWLTGPKQLNPNDVTICCDEAGFDGHPRYGTRRSAIIEAIRSLVETWRDRAFELLVFISGHGFALDHWQTRAVDVLVCSDYENSRVSGFACVRLDELREKLSFSVGGGHHYFFIDSSRTLITADELMVPALGIVLGRAMRGLPTRYTMYSTAYGEGASLYSSFSGALIDGLNGKGRAKMWVGGEIYVTFDSLTEYVQSRLNQPIDSHRDGPGRGYLLKIDHLPTYRLSVEIRNARPDDEFTLLLRWQEFYHEHTFRGSSTELTLLPNYYGLRLFWQGLELSQVNPPPGQILDIFSDCHAFFEKT